MHPQQPYEKEKTVSGMKNGLKKMWLMNADDPFSQQYKDMTDDWSGLSVFKYVKKKIHAAAQIYCI